LSDGSGNYLFLFMYMAILNGGILAISVVKRRKPKAQSTRLTSGITR